ncbi:hypothetical protein TRFO_20836 [Tritrichomonas foetus]|uniref:Uncharacterized protein n=1 Tax=Tritrichomonas foetus TaxID=1144522 RepID=A0A1J4KF02_9EUKA|nr:hypothetical protein TRFO_20836 [Tritrichomonas foetus]|eukprot:OHT10033.1 hypothetical protein TRFO_20836 [Tritrichomonas foetus]
MNEELFNKIQELVALMSSESIGPAEMCRYNREKQEILAFPKNIYILISALQSQTIPTNVSLEILKYVHEFILFYKTAYNLEEILTDLLQINVSEPALIHALSEPLIICVVYLFLSERKIFLPIFEDDKNSATELETLVIIGFLNTMSEYPESGSKENAVIVREMKKSFLLAFIKFGIRILKTNPIEGIAILKSGVSFGYCIDSSKPISIQSNIMEHFYSNEIFDIFTFFTINGNLETSMNVIQIVTLLARGCDIWSRHNDVVQNLQQYIINVLKNTNILANHAISICFQNLFLAIRPKTTARPYDEVIQFLYEMCNNVIQQSPLSLTIIYPGILNMFKEFTTKNKEYFNIFLMEMKESFQQYVEAILKSFDDDVEKTTEIIFEEQNVDQIQTSLRRLLVFTDKNTIPQYLMSLFNSLLNSNNTNDTSTELSNNTSNLNGFDISSVMKIGFLMLVLISCYMKTDLFTEKPALASLVDLLFILISQIQPKLQLFYSISKENGYTFFFGEYMVQAVYTFLKAFIINDINPLKQGQLFLSISEFLQTVQSISAVSQNIFGFLLTILQNNYENDITTSVLTTFLNNKLLCETIIHETEFPSYFLSNYLTIPCEMVYYLILTKLLFENPEKHDEFLQSLSSHFIHLLSTEDELTEMNISRFFEMITSFFHATIASNKFYEFYVYIYDTFGDAIRNISKTKFSNYVVKFVHGLTEKDGDIMLPKNKESFPSYSPHSFRIFKYFTEILTNCMRTTTVNPILVNESVFTSAFPINDIYKQEVIPIVTQDEGDWEVITSNVKAMINFLQSPFPNFGVMEYYQDTCIFEYLNCLIEQILKTSPLSLLSMPELFKSIIIVVKIISMNFTKIILNTQNFYNFVLILTKIAFLSDNEIILNNNFSILSNICENINLLKLPWKRSLDHHFILSFNMIIAADSSEDNVSFLYWYLCGEYDYTNEIKKQIVDGITQDVINQEVGQALDDLFHQAAYDGTRKDLKRFVLALNDFLDTVSRYSLRLDYIPSLSQYFVFK